MVQNIQQNPLAQLKDIKPIVEVHSDSFSIFIALVSVIVLVILFLIYKYTTRVKKTKTIPKRKVILQKLKDLDYSNTKEVVYSFSVDAFLFVTDKNKEEFKKIEKELAQYKYKKDEDTAQLPSELITQIQEFIKKLKGGKNKNDK